MQAILSQKGQVTIPKPLRDLLGLRPGESIDFHVEGSRLVGRKAVADEDPIESVRGIVPLPEGGVDAYLREVRGPEGW